jgi:hypothetical protein
MSTWRVRLILTGVAAVGLMGMGVSAGAQQAPGSASPLAACGPDGTQFKTSRGAVGDTTAAESADKATVYVIESSDPRRGRVLSRPPVRIGMGGVWMGALEEFSYVRFSAEPGTRHVCAQWSSHGNPTQDASLFNFDVEAGKTYYLRVQITPDFSVDMQPVSTDEGRFLVGATALSVSHAK